MTASEPGQALFARYAYPPNELGYCGPTDGSPLLQRASGDQAMDIAAHARQFEGAWTYLELIASAVGIDDPLDRRVVQAYWVGNDLLDRVAPSVLVARLGQELEGQVGGFWSRMGPAAEELALPHHSFHVFAVYPWVGLLGSAGDVPLSVLDRCRIRWGEVVGIDGERATVRSRPLRWDGDELSLGPEREEAVRWSSSGRSLVGGIVPGDHVSLHWDWVCDRLGAAELGALELTSARQLELTNTQLREGAR
ncbi:MAG: DUF6390 family protein [Acidimicrobiales bacterium]|jgi:hypothetical protein